MSKSSIAFRAIISILLMIGFYALALGISLGLLFIPYAEVVYGGRLHFKLAAICIISAFTILWAIRPRIDKFVQPGPRLLPEEHPELFSEISDIAKQLEQKMPEEVYLDPSVNAWVSNRGGFLGIGSKRIMGIGLPLLAILNKSELRGVLAHEFGHYHGGDTRLGPIIFKTRSAIIRTLQGLGDSLLQKPFLIYCKLFLRVTHGISRLQEYSADRLAAGIVGTNNFISGLKKVYSMAGIYDLYWQNEAAPVLEAGFYPGLMNGFQKYIKSDAIIKYIDVSISQQINEQVTQDPYDTHPSLKQRIDAIAKLSVKHEESKDTSSFTLINDIINLEKSLLSIIGGKENALKLKDVTWENIGPKVYIPLWKQGLNKYSLLVNGLTPGSIADISNNLDSFGTKLKKSIGKSVSKNEALEFASYITGIGLAVLLFEKGYKLIFTLGDAIKYKNGDIEIEPFNVFAKLKNGEFKKDEWIEKCEAFEISNIDMGTLISR